MSEYQSSQIGFIIDSPAIAPPAAPPAPKIFSAAPVAPAIAAQIENLGNCLLDAVVYAAMLEKMVAELQASSAGQSFYLQ